MEIIRASHAKSERFNTFLELNSQLDRELLEDCGYVVDIDGKLAGCFALKPVESSGYWLRQLYLQPEAADNIIVLLETVLALVKEQAAQILFVNSHNERVDTMLEALQFKHAEADSDIPSSDDQSGKWWIYQVS